MKKLFTITILLGIIIVLMPACSKDETNPEIVPTASFTVSSNSVYINDTVKFTNTSTNAGSYLWCFGDGNTSKMVIQLIVTIISVIIL